ncbi:MAG: hypothetical protein JXR15_13145 [Shimia sp.]|uniref:hypothetical protein n=1 Tax=Shimia sp. TaxID=1954381 RepID=UPI003B8B3F15
MNEFLIVSTSILLVDVTNVVLFAAIIVALSGPNPLARSCALILGHTLAYFVTGLLVIYGVAEMIAPVVDFLIDGFVNPAPINFAIGLGLGILLITVAIKGFMGKTPEGETEKPQSSESGGVMSSFVLGATLLIVGIPFAIPYFGFINELYRFEVPSKPLALLIYNIFYALPFVLMPLTFALAGPGIVGKLKSINAALNQTMAWLVPTLFLLLGTVAVADAMKFFLTGTGLI